MPTGKMEAGGALEWNVSKDKPWINLTQTSGNTASETDRIEVTVNRASVGYGTNNTGTIQVSSNGGSMSIQVTMSKDPVGVLRISFSSMIINDDKEGGEGDWRIKCTVNGEDAVWIAKSEAGTGESVNINQTFVTKPEWNSLEIACKVHEYDGGIGAEWEYVGENTHYYQKGVTGWPAGTYGQKEFAFNNDEGDVTLKYSISPAN